MKSDSLNNTSVDEYAKLLAQESTKEIIKARLSGKIFRLADFSKIQANPQAYAGEIQRWKTAIRKNLKEDTKGYGRKHRFAWGVEDDKPDEKYADLPENGVPSTKDELVALIDNFRLGPKFFRMKLKASQANAQFDEAIKFLSGGTVETLDEYIDADTNKEIAKNVELTRLTLSAALNNEMELPFMKGQYPNYKSIMEWVDEKTETETKTEYMYDLFKHLDNAMDGDGEVDAKCMEFRMALDLLYIDKAIQFKDWEHGDAKAEIFEPEAYTPSLSFMFMWRMKHLLGDDLWMKIEEEFKREIGVDKYNKEGWMQNKPTLFKIIKKHSKGKKAKVASVETTKYADDDDSDDDGCMEMDIDGMIFKVQPKFKGNGNTWKRNFTKKFNLQQSGNNRWQRRPQQQQSQQQFQPPRQPNKPSNSFNRNSVDQRKSDTPTSDQWWRCYKCRQDGHVNKYKGNQMCPTHNFRPKWFDSIPLASVKVAKPSNDDFVDNNNPDGHLNSIRECMLYSDSHSDSSQI